MYFFLLSFRSIASSRFSLVVLYLDACNSFNKHVFHIRLELEWFLIVRTYVKCQGFLSGIYIRLNTTVKVYEKVSIQKCDGDATESAPDFDRLGSKALYAFIYPNFMVNRYGPWMDTNLVIPLGPQKCQVIFDYFLDTSLKVDFLLISYYVEIYSTRECGIL